MAIKPLSLIENYTRQLLAISFSLEAKFTKVVVVRNSCRIMLTYDLESGKAKKRQRIRRNCLILMAGAIAVVLLILGISFWTEYGTTVAPRDANADKIVVEDPLRTVILIQDSDFFS
jgi:hypothetical protein